jgi:hypothetical protein
MRKIGLVVLLLAACGSESAGITIAITAERFVKVDGKAVTLDELGTLLAARRDAAPLESLGKASTLPVVLQIEDDALWRDVRWVMTVVEEQKLWRLSLPGGRDAPLPVDSTIHTRPSDGVALLVRILVLDDGQYMLGDRKTRDIDEIGTWIATAERDGVLCSIGGIAAETCATWRRVRPAFDLLRSLRMKRIEFEYAIPPHRDRTRSPLSKARPGPFPTRWSGTFIVDFWSGSDEYEDPFGPETEEPVPPDEGLVALLDSHRATHRLEALATDDTLRKTASLHAKEMDRLGYFGHFSPVPGNHSPSDRLATQGWPEERRHAELLAKADTEQAAFEAFLAKSENVAILADPAFRYVGAARSGDCWVVLLGANR